QTVFGKLWEEFKQCSSSGLLKPTCSKELQEATRQEFCRQVEAIQNQIQSGKIKKAILSRVRLVPKPEKFSVADTFEKLCKKYPDAFVSLIHLPDTGCWMGASPELLVSSDGKELKTVALAGTRKVGRRKSEAGRQKSEDIDWSEK